MYVGRNKEGLRYERTHDRDNGKGGPSAIALKISRSHFRSSVWVSMLLGIQLLLSLYTHFGGYFGGGVL